MGTKKNPSRCDCYHAAEMDEPMFVLLARDPIAPMLVRLWASIRGLTRGGSDRELARQREAMECAAAMVCWRSSNRR